MTRASALLLLLALPASAEPLRPAELPPAGYAGLQYVDSKGCLFARAGHGTEVLWLPRVSRQGVPDCDNPPSGRRVAVPGEAEAQPVPQAEATLPAEPRAVAAGAAEATGGFFVAVGSFGVQANARRAEARLRALNYGVMRGRGQGGSASLITVFAGPFPDAVAAAGARDALRGLGFPDATVIAP